MTNSGLKIMKISSNEWNSILRNFRKRGQPLQGMTIFLVFFTFLPEFPNFRLNGLLFGNSIIYDFLEPFPGNFLIISRSLYGNFRSFWSIRKRSELQDNIRERDWDLGRLLCPFGFCSVCLLVFVFFFKHNASLKYNGVKPRNGILGLDVIYQARKTVFDHISKHREEIWKYDA